VSTTSLIWIVVVVAVLLAAALVAGVVLSRRRRISLSEREQVEAPKGYQATGGVTLAAPEPVVVEPPVVVEHPVGDDAAVPRDSVKRGFVEVDLPEEASEIDEIEPTSGRLERLRGKLSRSRSTFGQGLLGLLGAGDLDEDSWEEVEDTLLMSDLGAAVTTQVVSALREQIASRGVRSADDARALLRDVLIDALHPNMDRSVHALPHSGKPAVVLVVGVNGVGKTTTTGKLARVLVADGRTVLLGAADTFRAAAADQLETWGSRVGATTVRGAEAADPASVAFEAVKQGMDAGVDTVLIDTAGRLHTKTGLMDELGKVKRVVEKQAKVDEVLLVLDATTGQNGLTQARVFSEVVDVTGIVLTKLDGTAKGGIVFQVQRELGVPVKLVGLGEGADHLAPFEPTAFVDALLG
jgi:fused signal recognition particle receptor